MAGQFVPLKINAEKTDGPEIARKYGVHGFPMILFINSDGIVEGKIGGYMPPQGFAPQMTQVAKTHAEFPVAEAKYRANPANGGLAVRMAGFYAERGQLDKAETALMAAEKSVSRPNGLVKAYYAVGDQFRVGHEYDRAIQLYKKGAKRAAGAEDIAYANMSIAVTYLSQRMAKEALPYLEATIRLPNCPPGIVEQARQLLAAVKKNG